MYEKSYLKFVIHITHLCAINLSKFLKNYKIIAESKLRVGSLYFSGSMSFVSNECRACRGDDIGRLDLIS